jgi:predicted nuclease with RNAse H fold
VTRAVGIDLGARAVWVVVAERRTSGRWVAADCERLDADEVDTGAVALLARGGTVAIDAPGGPSEGRHHHDERVVGKFRRGRCSEVGLRLAGHAVAWVAPGPGERVPGWMAVGFRVWSAVEAAGAEPLEVYPHAVFAELTGRRPPPKRTEAGRTCRLEVLRRDLDLPDGAEHWGHDPLDAAAAALVAAQHSDGRARPAGCGHRGAVPMWLPAPHG